MGAWDIFEQYDDINAIKSTRAFERKRYPDGLINKFKAQFYDRVDQQL